MDKETNVQRVINMIYQICGCSNDEAEEVLKECLERVVKRLRERFK